MFDYKHVVVSAEKLGAHWSNLHRTHFAVVPSAKPRTDAALAVDVDGLVEAFVATSDGAERKRIVGALLKLWKKGRVLWPVAVFCGQSAIKGAAMGHLTDLVLKLDRTAAEMRRLFETTEGTFHKDWSHRTRSNAANRIFKVVGGIMYSTTETITSLEHFSEIHFERFVNDASVNGRWPAETYGEMRKATKMTSNFFKDFHGAPRFGVDALKTVGGRDEQDRFVFDVNSLGMRWLKQAGRRWINSQPLLTQDSQRRSLGHFYNALMKINKISVYRAETAFSRENMLAVVEDAETWSSPYVQIKALNHIVRFMEWLRLDLIARKERSFEIQFSKDDFNHIAAEAPPRRSAESVVSARPMPDTYHGMLKRIITEDDFAWPKSLRDSKGNPVHFVASRNPEEHGSKPVFCEVIPRLLLLLLSLPIRTVQARRLDSGEGDARRWDPDSKAWDLNTGPNAGYWEQIGAKNTHRGVICEGRSSDGKNVTGFWINSNKTQDIKSGFNEQSGYFIPWENKDVLENLAAMRRWQETYNPVSGPLPAAYTKGFQDAPSRLIADGIPDRFYLFRHPDGEGRSGRESPVFRSHLYQFYLEALGKLEEELRKTDPTIKIVERSKHKKPIDAIYSMHGMRSTLLTALSDAGVPLDVISRLIAGHASILMTLKYIKHDYRHVSQVLNAARVAQIDKDRAAFPEMIKGVGFERAKVLIASVSEDALTQATQAYSEPSTWGQMDFGLCPNQGTKCSEGGPTREGRDQGRVRSFVGTLREETRNCVRCRFFVTGIPFFLPLWAHAMSIGAKLDALTKAVEKQDELVQSLRIQKYAADKLNERPDQVLVSRIRRAEEDLAGMQSRRNVALRDIEATLALVAKVRAIADEAAKDPTSDPCMTLVVNGETLPEVVGEKSTRLAVIDAVLQASRVFPSIHSDDLERERTGMLDRMCYRSGFEPLTAMFPDEAELRLAADALVARMLIEKQALALEPLVEGTATFQDLGLKETLDEACQNATGRSLARLLIRETVAITLQAAE